MRGDGGDGGEGEDGEDGEDVDKGKAQGSRRCEKVRGVVRCWRLANDMAGADGRKHVDDFTRQD